MFDAIFLINFLLYTVVSIGREGSKHCSCKIENLGKNHVCLRSRPVTLSRDGTT